MAEAIQKVLDKLRGVKPAGSGKWTALCPAHGDKKSSLSVAVGDNGMILLHCFAGCTYEEVRDALSLSDADLRPSADTRTRTYPSKTTATTQPSSTGLPVSGDGGCTLAEYAEAKQLTIAFLRGLGLCDVKYQQRPAVRIPYINEGGDEAAIRFRLALDKSDGEDRRFRWKPRSKLCLYGLSRLDFARRAGYVVLVEGESDSQTLWLHDVQALGLPGANNWREERDAPHLDAIPKIYVVVEPDRGGEAVVSWLSKSRIRDRVSLVRLNGFKDPSALYLDNPRRFRKRWKAALAAAQPWGEYTAGRAQAEQKQAWAECKELAQTTHILDKFSKTLTRRGVAGEENAAKLLFLCLVSRVLDRPVSLAVKGPSAGGKSFIVEKVLEFFPKTAHYDLSAMSEHSLAYSTEPLAHRFLVLFEAAGMSSDFASYLIRSLLSEGRIRYETVEKTKDGLKSRLIEREGPTGLIVTTTHVSLHPENETRLLTVTVHDSREQTRAVLLSQAVGAIDPPDMKPWHELQRWLDCVEHAVTIPYARCLAKAIQPVAVRLRRDFPALLGLIKSHAILHQADRKRASDGSVVATLKDYEAIRTLAEPVFAEGVGATVTAGVRDTVAAVARLRKEHGGVSVTAVAGALGLDKSAAWRRVQSALARDYLKNLEDRRGKPAHLVLGEPLPEGAEILPRPETLLMPVARLQAFPGGKCACARAAKVKVKKPRFRRKRNLRSIGRVHEC